MHCCSQVHVGILAVYPYLNLRKYRMKRLFFPGRETGDGSSSLLLLGRRRRTVPCLRSFWGGDEEPSPSFSQKNCPRTGQAKAV